MGVFVGAPVVGASVGASVGDSVTMFGRSSIEPMVTVVCNKRRRPLLIACCAIVQYRTCNAGYSSNSLGPNMVMKCVLLNPFHNEY